jgi:SAM-dependent methyltransferase
VLTACPLCNGEDLAPCLARERVAVFQNIRYPSAADAAAAATGSLHITHCNCCGFVFNAAYDPKLAVYSPQYENDQSASGTFCDYLDQIADRVLGALDPGGSPIVLEVGCGQGHFLKRLAGLPAARFNRFIGFDPAWRGDPAGMHLEIEPQLFDAEATRRIGAPIGAAVSRHVIEHVIDPIGFLGEIRTALAAAPGIKLMIETPCLEWIVGNNVIFDFFYEHCSYFTRDTLGFALHRAGYRVNRLETVFHGQYLWAESTVEEADVVIDLPHPIGLGEAITQLGELSERRLDALRGEVAAFNRSGSVALWGAGAKGATLAALVDPGATLIDCLVDINPRKQSTYLAMTAHPIVSPSDAANRGVRTILLLNPNYRSEVQRMIDDEALPFALLDAG